MAQQGITYPSHRYCTCITHSSQNSAVTCVMGQWGSFTQHLKLHNVRLRWRHHEIKWLRGLLEEHIGLNQASNVSGLYLQLALLCHNWKPNLPQNFPQITQRKLFERGPCYHLDLAHQCLVTKYCNLQLQENKKSRPSDDIIIFGLSRGHRWLCWDEYLTCTYRRWKYPVLKALSLSVRR